MKFNKTMLLLAVAFVTLTSAIPAPEAAPGKGSLYGLILNAISIGNLLKLNVREYAQLKGEKLSFKQKIVFRKSLKALRQGVRKQLISENTVINFNDYMQEAEKKFNVGGFILGFLLGLIGVALAHIFSKDKVFRRSSWQGLGAWIIVLLVLYLI